MAKRTIELQASKFDHHDDCLAAAERYVAESEHVEDWQVTARWGDSERDTIAVTIQE